MRTFALVEQYRHADLNLPKRHTKESAGYDLASAQTVIIQPGEIYLVPTGLKAYMPQGEVLLIIIRSSWAIKRGCVLANQVGVIDRDYVDNPENEGHIFIPLENKGAKPVTVQAGERIAQGLFVPFAVTDDDSSDILRSGGFGSTSR